MGFNSAFEGLIQTDIFYSKTDTGIYFLEKFIQLLVYQNNGTGFANRRKTDPYVKSQGQNTHNPSMIFPIAVA